MEDVNKDFLEKIKEKRIELYDLVNDCLNNKKGKQLLERLYNSYNLPTDMTNPNKNYFRDGRLSVVNQLLNIIDKINSDITNKIK